MNEFIYSVILSVKTLLNYKWFRDDALGYVAGLTGDSMSFR